MEQLEIRQLLQAVASGERSVDDALLQLKEAPFEDLGFAKLDHHRALRQGAAEVIYGAGKTPEQILKITQAMLAHGQKTVLITRLSKDAAEFLMPRLPLPPRQAGRWCRRWQSRWSRAPWAPASCQQCRRGPAHGR